MTTSKQDDAAIPPGEVRSSAPLGLDPKRASECGLTECRGKRMCNRCRQWADMTVLAELLPEGVYWQDQLTPGLLRELLAAERERWAAICRDVMAEHGGDPAGQLAEYGNRERLMAQCQAAGASQVLNRGLMA